MLRSKYFIITSMIFFPIKAQTFRTSYWVAHYFKVNNITAISSYPFLTLINYFYNNWLKLFFFFQIIIIIDLQYVSFSKLPFNNNDTNFQIEQIVLLISLSIVLTCTLYIILELPLFDCIIILFSGHPGISVNELSPLSLRRWNIRHFKFDFYRLKMADSLLLEEVTSPRKREL